jgi:hypothetical protein
MLREARLALPLHGVRGPTHGVEPSGKTLTTEAREIYLGDRFAL